MATIAEAQAQIVENFSLLGAWDEKYAYLIELGEEMPEMDPALKTEENLVKGCQSSVWFHMQNEGGLLYLEADSDSMIVKGIAALLVQVVSGHHPQEILAMDMNFLDEIGMWRHLSSQRNNGLMAMLKHIREYTQESGG